MHFLKDILTLPVTIGSWPVSATKVGPARFQVWINVVRFRFAPPYLMILATPLRGARPEILPGAHNFCRRPCDMMKVYVTYYFVIRQLSRSAGHSSRRIFCDQIIIRSVKIECLSLYHNINSLI